MVERLTEIKRTRFDSLKASPIFLVVCAERRRQRSVKPLHWKHRGFDSLHYHHYARNSRKIGYPRVSSEGSTPSSSVADSGRFPGACMVSSFFGGVGVIGNILGLQPGATRSSLVPSTIFFVLLQQQKTVFCSDRRLAIWIHLRNSKYCKWKNLYWSTKTFM